jgi:NifB/MoaA-like Fe-S oxidoreductase
MRRSLYLKDDDYRLSFLYGNFTTLTRFTEADLERVVDEGLSPLHVSVHATDPDVRVRMLRNRRGATSLRWLRALLDHGITVHGQIVVCPEVNDGAVLDATLAGVLDEYPELASLCVVPLGISAFNPEPSLRAHTVDEAAAVVDTVESWQSTYLDVLGHRLAFASDEYYLLAGRPFPDADAYEGFAMHEDGVGMARLFAMELAGEVDVAQSTPQSGFFSWVDGAPAEGYRATRVQVLGARSGPSARPAHREVAVLTGEYGARVLEPLLADREHVRVVPVPNEFFGGTTAVTGLLVGADVARVLRDQPEGDRYLLPDVCLSQGRFLDGTTPDDLPRPVEIVPTDGVSLRKALVA